MVEKHHTEERTVYYSVYCTVFRRNIQDAFVTNGQCVFFLGYLNGSCQHLCCQEAVNIVIKCVQLHSGHLVSPDADFMGSIQ